MVRTPTAKAATHLYGKKLYHQRAQQILPILVRQAIAGNEITYGQVALEIGISNPRVLNYPLGSIGTTLETLSNELSISIPPIQCLVVNKNTKLPGEGIGWFLQGRLKDDFNLLSRSEKVAIVRSLHGEIFDFDRWHLVLGRIGLAYPDEGLDAQPNEDQQNHFGRKESKDHKRLKEYVAQHPHLIGIKNCLSGKTEYGLLSGDRMDVSFLTQKEWIGVEVKSKKSSDDDVVRGIFQCVKYNAVINAELGVAGSRRTGMAVLVFEGKFCLSGDCKLLKSMQS